ncbi:hypothetical protein [Nocardia beijingensis]|uniref:hypothetical protein n=1 Tax=Nocardia beijingensis TaxID=95162 RepID=UPI001894E453|nr:hypothetical protein [Nocardia beijingensis]MBF6073827.1 hypothetical protein [Nocardia beijingensis]
MVYLTDRGWQVAEFANSVAESVEREWSAHLGAEGMRHLRQALNRLREITDPYAENSGPVD